MKALAVALLVAGLVLSGCAGSGTPTSTEPTFEPGKATKDTGVIHGLVLDTKIVPISNATVVLKSSTSKAKTDAQGRFSFDDLKPGVYFVTASKPGFATAQTSATVVAGEDSPAITKVFLQADASTKPYYLQTHHTGFISCGAHTAQFVSDASICDPTGAAGYAARDDSRPRFIVDSPPRYLQTEISWTASQVLGNELTVIESPCESVDSQSACYDGAGGSGDDQRLCNNGGPSPIICRMNLTHSGSRLADGSYWDGNGVGLNESRLGQADRAAFVVAMYAGCFNGCVLGAVGAGFDLEQTFDVYNTYFYGYEPPKDWTFLGSSKVPDPPKT